VARCRPEGLRLQAGDSGSAVGRLFTARRKRHSQLFHHWNADAGCQVGAKGEDHGLIMVN